MSSDMEPTVRPATRNDLGPINEIYNEYIVDSHTSFDTEPWTIEQRVDWFEKYEAGVTRYQVLVLEIADQIVGFASSRPFRHKAAYDSSVETTIVLASDATGRGLGRMLLEELVERLAAAGVHRAYALIALPNAPSIKLHRLVGYRAVGTLDEVGHKLDQFHSVHIMELPL